MATASRSRASVGAKQSSRASDRAPIAADPVRTWAIPALAVATIGVAAALDAAEIVGTTLALAATIVASLVLLLYIGERPLVLGAHPARDRMLGAGFAAVWFVACYFPFHARLYPGRPLVAGAEVTSTGSGLPLHIPASGARRVDLLLEGKLTPGPGGDVAPPVHYTLTVEEAGGGSRAVEGTFEDHLATRRLGRRGTAVVHQTHTADVRVLDNPGRGAITVTQLVLEPASAQPITVSAYAHPLPGPILLGLATVVLLAAAITFDRFGPVPETDGALTISTAAALGTAYIFWTSNFVRPDYSALVGSVILGGVVGFVAGALLWWMTKRLIVRPTR
jgi:hypothetical protein